MNKKEFELRQEILDRFDKTGKVDPDLMIKLNYYRGLNKMVEADFSGNFTNPENCQENDIGIVVNEGAYEEKTNFKGQVYKQLNIGIEVNNKKLVHSPGMDEGKKLVKAWGKETKGWIGKKFKCHVINYKSMGITKSRIEIEAFD